MFGLMILGRMCGQGGLHYIMMQLCIQQHVNLSQRMLMLLNLLNDVEKNPGPVLYDKIYIVYWITICIYFNIKVIFFLHFCAFCYWELFYHMLVIETQDL